MPAPDPRGIYFNANLLPEPEYHYVCWLDVMGTAQLMLRSLPIAANFVFKLHCAVLEAQEELGLSRDILLYPVMDGVFITSARRNPLQRLLNQTLCRLALTFLNEPQPFHRFLVRGAIAFGPLFHGSSLPDPVADVLARNPYIRDSILMGIPMAQAYQAERDAPPFGIAAEASSRAFAPEQDHPFRFLWLDWFRYCSPPIDPQAMLKGLEEYFEWHRRHTHLTAYDIKRIEHHCQLAREYFTSSATKVEEGPTTGAS
jgi:hypothetical protein